MNKTFRLLFLAVLIIPALASAVTLAPFPQPQDDPLPINKDDPKIPCDQIIARLQNYNSMARLHDQAITGFLGQVSQKVQDWYSVLKPLEGKPDTIADGTFETIQDGAAKIDDITNMAYDNSDLLAARMELIIVSARDCLPQPAVKKP